MVSLQYFILTQSRSKYSGWLSIAGRQNVLSGGHRRSAEENKASAVVQGSSIADEVKVAGDQSVPVIKMDITVAVAEEVDVHQPVPVAM